MKGTLFSADFVRDSGQNLRLMELNTDTAVLDSKVSDVDLSSFITVLQNNNITELDVIYKPTLHNKLVDHIQSTIESDATFITSFNKHDEDVNTIYPGAVSDADHKFILRLAYDESAVFDSTYASNRLNVYNLFTTSSINDYTVAYYHSSSDGVVNTLTNEFNASNLPDAAIKDTDESFNPIDFFKIGSEVSGESDNDKWTGFVNENKAADKLIEQFHYHSSSLDGNKVTSVRQFSIVYGTSLDVVNLLSYNISSIFDLPTDLSSEVDASNYSSKLSDHHYYEFTTNFIKADAAGMLSTHKIQKADDTWEELGNLSVGDKIKSYFISGSPQLEGDRETLEWSSPGKSFPSGSYITSSDVVYKDSRNQKYGGMVEVKVDSESVFSGVNKQFLVYDSGSDVMRYKHSTALDPDNDYFYTINGDLIDIDEANFFVTSDSGLTFIDLDVEDTDTYILSGSTAWHSIVSHNAPCFVAGTQISLHDGSVKNIEDVVEGDVVLTYNFKKNVREPKPVAAISVKQVDVTIKYTFSDESSLQATGDHPLYSPSKESWISRDPDFTLKMYGLTTQMAEIGDEVAKADGSVASITDLERVDGKVIVHNLKSVDGNHNFYANEFLVHNRCFVAGTPITLVDGETKAIEKIIKGESVQTYNTETGVFEPGTVGELKEHDADNVVEVNLSNGINIRCTAEHPFWVRGNKWIPAGELKVGHIVKTDVDTAETVEGVTPVEGTHKVYNLLSVSSNHNFFANNILVHNK